MVWYLFGVHIINFIRSFSSRVEKYLIVYVHASNISQHWKREFLSPRSYQISSIYQANMGHFEGWNSFTRKNLMESVQLMLEFTSQSRVGRKALWRIMERLTRIRGVRHFIHPDMTGLGPTSLCAMNTAKGIKRNCNYYHHHHHHHHHHHYY